jgi:predicted nucleic acid-binding protein
MRNHFKVYWQDALCYALVALLVDEPAAAEIEELLRHRDCAVALVNLAEAVDITCRVHGVQEEEVRGTLEPLIASAKISPVAPSEATAWRAARLRIRYYGSKTRPLSVADCFLLASVREEDSIATSDPPLAEVARAEGIEVIPLPDSTGRRP